MSGTMADVAKKPLPGAQTPVPPDPPPLPLFTGPQTDWLFKTTRPTFAPIQVHFAVNSADSTYLASLIEQGIDLNYVTLDGNTPLTLAILKEQFDMAQMLASGGADVNRPEQGPWKRKPIHLAARAGQLSLLKTLVHNGASVHAADSTLFTPLHWAAHSGHMELVEHLVDVGAHVNVRDDRGRTPLFRAAENGHIDLVRYLHLNGARLSIRDNYGWTPLYQTIVCANINMVTTLLEFGIDIYLVDTKGDTPLHVAAGRLKRGNMGVLSCTDVSIFMRDLNIATPAVQEAIQTVGADSTLVEILLDYGARPNVLNVETKTPFTLAAEEGNIGVLKLLISAGMDLKQERWLHARAWPAPLAGDERTSEWLAKLADLEVHVRPLMDCCRFVIREALHRRISSKIKQLPLPKKLKQFLELECV